MYNVLYVHCSMWNNHTSVVVFLSQIVIIDSLHSKFCYDGMWVCLNNREADSE